VLPISFYANTVAALTLTLVATSECLSYRRNSRPFPTQRRRTIPLYQEGWLEPALSMPRPFSSHRPSPVHSCCRSSGRETGCVVWPPRDLSEQDHLQDLPLTTDTKRLSHKPWHTQLRQFLISRVLPKVPAARSFPARNCELPRLSSAAILTSGKATKCPSHHLFGAPPTRFPLSKGGQGLCSSPSALKSPRRRHSLQLSLRGAPLPRPSPPPATATKQSRLAPVALLDLRSAPLPSRERGQG